MTEILVISLKARIGRRGRKHIKEFNPSVIIG
jgi:hypothetical protein